LLINFYRDNQTITDLKIENIKEYLSKDYKAVIIVDEESQFDSILLHLNIKEEFESVESYEALTALNSIVVLVFNFFHYMEQDKEEVISRIVIILSKDYLIIFNKERDRHFLHICEQALNARKINDTASVLHLIFSTTLNYYSELIDSWTDDIGLIESNILREDITRDSYVRLSSFRVDIIHLRRVMRRQAEYLRELILMENEMLSKTLKFSFEMDYEKSIEASRSLDKLNDIILNIYSLYLATLNIQQNETMKVLTVIASIFLPISFLASLFGMNLEMPFLNYTYAFEICLTFMVVLTLFVTLIFRKKRWI
jgi:magnesium transporter